MARGVLYLLIRKGFPLSRLSGYYGVRTDSWSQHELRTLVMEQIIRIGVLFRKGFFRFSQVIRVSKANLV